MWDLSPRLKDSWDSESVNKTILLIGGSGPIGAAILRKCADLGFRTINMDLREGPVDRSPNDPEAVFIEGDVREAKSFHKVLEQLDYQQSELAGVVYLAMINPEMSLAPRRHGSESSVFPQFDELREELDVGLGGACRTFEVLGTRIVRDKASVVIVSSDLGLIAPDQRVYGGIGPGIFKSPGYTVTKHGLIGLARHMGVALASQGVRVNAIAPGPVGPLQSSSLRQELEFRIPMGRLARPSEVASGIWFLLSEESSFVNASVLTLDGGRTAW